MVLSKHIKLLYGSFRQISNAHGTYSCPIVLIFGTCFCYHKRRLYLNFQVSNFIINKHKQINRSLHESISNWFSMRKDAFFEKIERHFFCWKLSNFSIKKSIFALSTFWYSRNPFVYKQMAIVHRSPKLKFYFLFLLQSSSFFTEEMIKKFLPTKYLHT